MDALAWAALVPDDPGGPAGKRINLLLERFFRISRMNMTCGCPGFSKAGAPQVVRRLSGDDWE